MYSNLYSWATKACRLFSLLSQAQERAWRKTTTWTHKIRRKNRIRRLWLMLIQMVVCWLRFSWTQLTRLTSVNKCRIDHTQSTWTSLFQTKESLILRKRRVWSIRKDPMEQSNSYSKKIPQKRLTSCYKTCKIWAMRAHSGSVILRSRFRSSLIPAQHGPGYSRRLVASRTQRARWEGKDSSSRNQRTSKWILLVVKSLLMEEDMWWATPLKIEAASLKKMLAVCPSLTSLL